MKPSVRIFMPIFGEKFVDMAMKVAIPSLLDTENLPAVARDYEVHIDIATTAHDETKINSFSEVSALSGLASIHFTHISVDGKEGFGDPRDIARFQVRSLRIAAQNQAMAIHHFADLLLSRASFSNLVRRLESCRAVLCTAGRVNVDGFVDSLREFRAGNALSISSRDLVRLHLIHQHEEMLGYEVTGSNTPDTPWLMLWSDLGLSQQLVRAHALNPAGINFRDWSDDDVETYLSALNDSTIDDPPSMRVLLGDLANIHIVTDSDEYFCTSPTDSARWKRGLPSHLIPADRLSLSESLVRFQQRTRVNEYSRYFVTIPIRWHSTSDTSWLEEKARETQQIVSAASIVLFSQVPFAKLLSTSGPLGGVTWTDLIRQVKSKSMLATLSFSARVLARPLEKALQTGRVAKVESFMRRTKFPGRRFLERLARQLLLVRRRLH